MKIFDRVNLYLSMLFKLCIYLIMLELAYDRGFSDAKKENQKILSNCQAVIGKK